MAIMHSPAHGAMFYDTVYSIIHPGTRTSRVPLVLIFRSASPRRVCGGTCRQVSLGNVSKLPCHRPAPRTASLPQTQSVDHDGNRAPRPCNGASR